MPGVSSLQVNVLFWLAECAHEWRCPVCLERALAVDVVVLPRGLELLLKVFVEVLACLAQMRLHNLASECHSLRLGDEELAVWHALLGHAFRGIILDNISGELVDWSTVVVVEVAWEDAVV